jgi:hypothetical protein
MTANTAPIFTLTPNAVISPAVTAANTATDGTGNTTTIFTGGANGSMLRGIVFKATGTNAATVARIFLNNGSTSATATNNALIGELSLPATTASNSQSIGPDFYYPFPSPGLFVPSGYKILVCYGTAPSGGVIAVPNGGDF